MRRALIAPLLLALPLFVSSPTPGEEAPPPAPLAPAPDAAETAVDLIGTWHVLVHYVDESTANPAQPRWDDRIWVFEDHGDGIRWFVYPIVVFSDPTGRFENVGTRMQRRVLHAWQPDEGQLLNILQGLEINHRGSRSKMLRSSGGGAWRSTRRAMTTSASVLAYQEIWRIDGLPHRPVFAREDSLSSARTEALEGRTRYATLAISPDAMVVRGTYERDGVRHGTFRMLRAAPVRELDSDGPTPNAAQRDRVAEQVRREYARRLREGDATVVRELRSILQEPRGRRR